jgi:transposase-like protein
MRQTIYPSSVKASFLAKMVAPNAPSVVELAKEFNIPYQTAYSWKIAMLKKKNVTQLNAPQRPHDKSPEAKLQAVLDTMGMTEQDQGVYCRTHGIYSNHLDAWKKQMLEGLGVASSNERKAESLQASKEIKKLKRDLERKDKALAEVSALLILKKKADLLWGVDEDA